MQIPEMLQNTMLLDLRLKTRFLHEWQEFLINTLLWENIWTSTTADTLCAQIAGIPNQRAAL